MRRDWSALIGIAFSLTMTVVNASTFEMVSLNNSGQPPATSTPNGSNWPAAVTPDGRYVVFSVSADSLVSDPNATNNQVYLRDRVAGTTELISQSTAGVAANGNDVSRPTISNDGCRVAFQTYADNLVPGDNNGTSNVFVRNRCTNPKTTEMVDVFPDGSPGTGQGLEPRISGDGRKVVFTSYTQNIVTGLTNHNGQTCGDAIYVRDLDARLTTALMRPDGGCLSGREPDLSSDGSRIAFWSTNPYTPANTFGMWDIYLYDSAANSFTLVSADAIGVAQQQSDGINGGEGISTVTAPAISQDGRIVAFRSRGFGLVPSLVTTSGTSQLYVKDTYSGEIIVASVDSSGTIVGNGHSSGYGYGIRPGLSGDGQYVVFETTATNLVPQTGGFVMHDNFGSATTGFTNIATNTPPDISPSGRYITTGSGSPMDSRFSSRGIFLLDLSTTTFPGNRNNYSITKTSTGFTVIDKVGSGGTVALTGAAQIKFADMTVNLLIGDLSRTIDPATLKTLVELYLGFFNRIPGADGLSYWIAQKNAGQSITQIAESFYAAGIQYSSLTGFSAGMSNDDFINTVYRNVLDRPAGASADGLAYWRGKLLDGSATRGSLVTDILFSAHSYKGDPTWGWVADLLDNKYSVASFFCLQQGLNYSTPEIAIAEGMAIAAAVTPTSTAAATALIGVTDTGFNLAAP